MLQELRQGLEAFKSSIRCRRELGGGKDKVNRQQAAWWGTPYAFLGLGELINRKSVFPLLTDSGTLKNVPQS